MAIPKRKAIRQAQSTTHQGTNTPFGSINRFNRQTQKQGYGRSGFQKPVPGVAPTPGAVKPLAAGVNKQLARMGTPSTAPNPATATDPAQQKQAILKQRIARPPKATQHNENPFPHGQPPNSPGSPGGPAGAQQRQMGLRQEMMKRLRKRSSFA